MINNEDKNWKKIAFYFAECISAMIENSNQLNVPPEIVIHKNLLVSKCILGILRGENMVIVSAGEKEIVDRLNKAKSDCEKKLIDKDKLKNNA